MINVSMVAEQFRDALHLASPALDRKGVMPVLSSFLVEAEREEVRVSAMDLMLGIRVSIAGSVDAHGREIYYGPTLTDWCSKIGDGEITIRRKEESATSPTVFSAGRNRLTVNHLDVGDFPDIPSWEESTRLATVAADDLAYLLESVVVSCATDEGRPVLACVMVRIEPELLVVAAADGYRMSYLERPGTHEVKEPLVLLIPRRSIKALLSLIKSQKPATVDFRKPDIGARVMARFGPVEWVSGLIEGVFPDVQQLIPNVTPQSHHEIRFEADSLHRAMAPLVGISRQNNDVMHLDFTNAGDEVTPGQITITAVSKERGDGVGGCDAEIVLSDTQDRTVMVSWQFLADVLGILKGQAVVLRVAGANAGLLFRPTGVPSGNEHAHVVMPMAK